MSNILTSFQTSLLQSVEYCSFCNKDNLYLHIPSKAPKISTFNPNMKCSSYVADHTLKFSSSLPLIPCKSYVPSNVKDLSFKASFTRPKHASCYVKQQKHNKGFVVGCASWDLVAELERELEAEMKNPQEGEEKGGIGIARFRHKCGERKGVVALLECLEREAIMGEDVGKEAKDYNRRARLFDTSSRVFQALKEHNNDAASP
ncbi:hypothetical protein RIF29_17012 [Crotalaria pallida]|uniref:Uncharacterized protein n=1 Tax=Crotalaria pallida TaxID=3830 RepID=A0AAN9FIG3_CROPI